jgi:uncharacterized Zn finger protein
MPPQPCPACFESTPRHLHETSKEAAVDYYRCLKCGHIWTVNKMNPLIVANVTPLPKKPPHQSGS